MTEPMTTAELTEVHAKLAVIIGQFEKGGETLLAAQLSYVSDLVEGRLADLPKT